MNQPNRNTNTPARPQVIKRQGLSFAPQPNVNLIAERGLLGSVILGSKDNFADAAHVQADDFWLEAHRTLWGLICETVEAGDDPSVPGLIARAQCKADSQEPGWGFDKIKAMLVLAGDVCDVNVVPALTSHFAAQVVTYRARRAVEASLQEQLRLVRSPDAHPEQVLHSPTEEALAQVQRLQASQTTQAASDGARQVLEGINEPKEVPSISTGIWGLDDQLKHGLHPGDLTILLGRTGGGKSSLARQMALMAAGLDHPTLYLCTEMTATKVWVALTAASSKVAAHKIKEGRLSPEEDARVQRALVRLASLPLWVDDTQAFTTDSLLGLVKAFDRRLRQDEGRGLGVLVVDYFQIIEPDEWEQRATRAAQLSRLARRLQQFAREANCAVVLLAQVKGEAVSQRRPPRQRDTAEAGGAESWAQVILGVHRPWLDDPERDKAEAEIHVIKARESEPGCIPVRWNGAVGRFEERGDWMPTTPPPKPGCR